MLYCFVSPDEAWQKITSPLTHTLVPEFGMGNINQYFVCRHVLGSKLLTTSPSTRSPLTHQRWPHTTPPDCHGRSYTGNCVKAVCLPKITSDRVFTLRLNMEADTAGITFAECGCPAGRGPHRSCKHVTALLLCRRGVCLFEV